MTAKKKNMAASVRNRLLAIAKEAGEPFDLVLSRYAVERLLHRLARSAYADEFVVKGATLFTVWTNAPHRATRDLDLLGRGEPNLERLAEVFREVVSTVVEDDGLAFDATTVRAARIKEDADYEGVRVQFIGALAEARVPVQVDVGFGDAVVPAPTVTEFPTLLDLPAPKLRAYPMEAVIAEKLHAMVVLDAANSRMKDFYDLWLLSKRFDFAGARLTSAVRATFERRKTEIPQDDPIALTDAFVHQRGKNAQWTAFLKKALPEDVPTSVLAVIADLRTFLLPVLHEAHARTKALTWKAGGPWS